MIRELEQVVLLKLNGWFGEGARLVKAFSASGYPTFVLLDSEAEVISKWGGYDKAAFLRSLEDGLSKAQVS